MSNSSNSGLLTWSEIKDWCIVYGLEAFIAVIANGLTALIIIYNTFLHKRFYYLLLSLAIADFLVGAVSCPMFIYVIWGFSSPEGRQHKVDPKVANGQTIVEIFTSYASIYSLVAIALERLAAVLSPYKHQQEARSSYFSAIIISWLLALFTALIWLTRFINDQVHFNRVFFIIMFLLSLSILIVLVCYSVIAYKLCSTASDSISLRTQREHRVALTLLVASVLFIALWLPFQVVNYIFFFDKSKAINHHSIYASKFLHYFNSIINPFIYALMMTEFRKGFRNIFCCSNEIDEPKSPGTVKPISRKMRNQGYEKDDVTMTQVSGVL